MDTSFYQRDLGTNRKWKICLCEEICGKHGVHNVSDTEPYLVVLRRIPTAIRDHTRRRIPSGLAKLGYVGSQAEKPHHHRRFDGRNGPKGGFTVYEKESLQKHQRVYIIQKLFQKGKYHRTISLNAHYMVLFKNPRDVSQIYSIAQQMFPRNATYMLQSFVAATS